MKRNIPPHSMSLWRHFFDRERTEEELTDSMIQWQEKWRWSFMKVNPPACYHVIDWGSRYEFFDDPLKEPVQIEAAITRESDIEKIGNLDITTGMLGTQLKVLRNLRAHFGPALPILETVFSPIEIAHRLLRSREEFRLLMETSPTATHRLLSRITDVFEQFCSGVMEWGGADGIFFATKWANAESLPWDHYEEFGKPYEMRILSKLKDALVVLHVCGSQTYLDRMFDYPVDIFSYDFFAGSAPAAPPADRIMGGIDPELLKSNVEAAIERLRPYKKLPNWIAGPSCVLLPDTPEENIHKIRAAVL